MTDPSFLTDAAGVVRELTGELIAARAWLERAFNALDDKDPHPVAIVLAVERINQAAAIIDRATAASLVLSARIELGEQALRELERISQITVADLDSEKVTGATIVCRVLRFFEQPVEDES